MKQNKFKIITPSFNNEEWVQYNVASVLNQTYTNYEVLYIDDASTDNTYQKVVDIVGEMPNWKVIKNPHNVGAVSNYFDHLDFVDGEDILIHLDGDDWLYDETVLEKLNDLYNREDCWMTYGGFIVWNGFDEEPTLPYPQSTEYPEFIHKHKKYRLDAWRPSHLRTYKGFLIKAIQRDDLRDLAENKDYWHASDLAFQYPCLEMCTPDRVKLIDFYACVYNHSKSNASRTHERESVDNSKYEYEIRQRKHYKQGLSGDKLPQVNVYPRNYYCESHSVPKNFTYVYESPHKEYDLVVLYDLAILDYIEGRVSLERTVPIVAVLGEQREYFQSRIALAVEENYDKFDWILTYDKKILSITPNAKFLPSQIQTTQFNRLPNPQGLPPYKSDGVDTFELPDSIYQMYPKTKLVSAVASTKSFLPGHVKRLELIDSIKDRIDLFGRGTSREIVSKLDALKDYRFSIAIENCNYDDYYFTEKIVDCFLTGTIPIYYGCPHIGDFFDVRGILMFNTIEELNNIVDNLSEDKYNSMLEYAKINFNKCFQWPINNDMLYEQYYKPIIEKTFNLYE